MTKEPFRLLPPKRERSVEVFENRPTRQRPLFLDPFKTIDTIPQEADR